ncbi:MAG: hypothetical protein Q9220_002096 [cf. Caloplaca sp. 1 TL-2023]
MFFPKRSLVLFTRKTSKFRSLMTTQLVHIPEVERLSPLVLRILGGNPGKFTLQGTNTYLIGLGARRLLIDTGEGRPSWAKLLTDILNTENTAVSDVLITHWHPDHVGGIADLLKACPEAKVHKHSPGKGQQPIEDGQKFMAQGAELRAFHCPGHTTDHMAFVLEEENAMFTGDNVLGHGTAVFEDLSTYMASLERMCEQNPGRAYPGHGPVIEDGKKRIKEYIEHRHRREREVLDVLADARTDVSAADDGDASDQGARSPMEMVKVIYKDVPENLHEPAARGVEQVLQKLANEGKIARCADGNRWKTVQSISAVM